MRLGSRSPSPVSGCWSPCSARRERLSLRRQSLFISRSIPACVAMAQPSSEAVALATRIAGDPYLRLASIFTHFASADEPDEPFTAAQLQEFDRVVDARPGRRCAAAAASCANSAGILTGRGTDYAMARAGIALYGVPPSSDGAVVARHARRHEHREPHHSPDCVGTRRHRWIQQDVSRHFANARQPWCRLGMPTATGARCPDVPG